MKLDRRSFLRLSCASAVLGKLPKPAFADDGLNLDSLKSKFKSLESKIQEAQTDELKRAYKDITASEDETLSYEVLNHFINNNAVKKAFALGENATKATIRLISSPLFHSRSVAINDGLAVLAILRSDIDLYERHSKGELDLGDRLEYVERRLRASSDLMDANMSYLQDLETNKDKFKPREEDLELARKYALTRDESLREQLVTRLKERISNSEEYIRYITRVNGRKEDILTNMGIKERIASEGRLTSKEEARRHSRLAEEYFNSNNYSNALEEQKKAISLDPTNSIYYYSLGFILFKQGRYNEAIPELKTAITLNPNFDDPYSVLGKSFSHLKRFNEGLHYAKIYLKIGDNQIALKQAEEYVLACQKSGIK